MGHRYIGSKSRILEDIVERIEEVVPHGERVADLMCGTGTVSLELRKRGYRVTATDIMSQACHITKAQLFLQEPPEFRGAEEYITEEGQTFLTEPSNYERMIRTLNNLEPMKGYFWREFSPGGRPRNGCGPRRYFTSENAQKIDAARTFIKELRDANAISDIEHSLLIHDLIMSANDVANIAGTYGHYLSEFVTRALQPIEFTATEFERGGPSNGHEVIWGPAEDLAPQITASLCYIDPPYMKRQYAANYHILETIARGDTPKAAGKSGLRPWRDEYSDFCSKRKIRSAFRKILNSANSDLFLISYSSEGLLPKEQLIKIFNKFGKVTLDEFPNKRFKSRDEPAREFVTEYLFLLERRKGYADP